MIYKSIPWHPNVDTDTSIEALKIGNMLVTEMKRRFPNVKAVCMDLHNSNDAYVDEICAAFPLESFQYNRGRVQTFPASLWTNQLRGIDLYIKKYSYVNVKIILPNDFENALERIRVIGKFQKIPPALFHAPNLGSVQLSGIMDGAEGMLGAPNLEKLVISRYNLDKFAFELGHLRNLKHLVLHRCNLKILPDFSQLTQLKTLVLDDLPYLETLENHWDALQNLESITLKKIGNNYCNGLYFNHLSKLKILRISGLKVDETLPFLGKMPMLETVKFQQMDLLELPTCVYEHASVKAFFIKNLPNLKPLPNAFWNQPQLAHLSIVGCPQWKLPKEVLIKDSLMKLNYDFPNFKDFNIVETPLKNKLLPFLKTFSYSTEQRLAIGKLLFEGVDKTTIVTMEKEAILKLLKQQNLIINLWIYENIHLLNAEQPKIPIDYKNKSIGYIGGTHQAKWIYKEKLISLNFDYQEIIQADTRYIILGNRISFPTHFWNYPHFFFTESNLNHFLAKTQPDFLQTGESNIEESIRTLLWSNKEANDELVLTMMESGGIPLALLPDLLLIAKSTMNQAIIYKLKKILKAYLSPSALKILAHPYMILYGYSDFDKYLKLAPDFDILQMIVCYYMRTRYLHVLKGFFDCEQSINHIYRSKMFEMVCDEARNNPQWGEDNWSDWQFTKSEMKHLFSNGQS